MVGAALGVNPWSKPDDAMRRMVRDYYDQPSEFTGNIATEYGTNNEPNATEDYQFETGNTVIEVGFIQHSDWLGASPDGLIGEDGVLEIKCPYGMRDAKNESDFKSIDDQPHYYAQMQIEMLSTGREWCDFYQWSAYASKLERVNFDPFWIEENLPKLKAFYDKYLVEREPDNAWRYIDGGQLVYNYKLKKAAFDVAKQEFEEAKAALIEAADGKSCTIGDVKVTMVNKKGSISYANAVKDLLPDADLSKYEGKASQSWRIT